MNSKELAGQTIEHLENKLTRDGKYSRDGQCLYEEDWIDFEKRIKEALNAFALKAIEATIDLTSELCTTMPIDKKRCAVLELTEQAWDEGKDACCDAIRALSPTEILEKINEEKKP